MRTIAALRELQRDTPDFDILASFPGAGELKESGVFNSDRGRELRSLLSKTEWESLRNCGLLNSHYTKPETISQMWRVVLHYIKPTKVLDIGCGTLGFLRHAPPIALDKLQRYVGVEKDLIAAKIASKYPSKIVNIYNRDIDDFSYPEPFDLAIGNIPFVGCKLPISIDSATLLMELHYRCFWHICQALEPGGIACILTSISTLDSSGCEAIKFRKYLDRRMEFLGAVRLPPGGSVEGRSQVTTDIVLLRKRDRPLQGSHNPWVYTAHIDGNPDLRINLHYRDRPDCLLGELTVDRLTGKRVGLKPNPLAVDLIFEKLVNRSSRRKMTDIYHDKIVPSLQDLDANIRWIRTHLEKEIADLRKRNEDLQLLASQRSQEEWDALQKRADDLDQENFKLRSQLMAIAGEPRSQQASVTAVPDVDIDHLNPEDFINE
jgi:SAM-dependent methyltransferase